MDEIDAQRQEVMQAASDSARRKIAAGALNAQLDRETELSRVRTQARWNEAQRSLAQMKRRGASEERLQQAADQAWAHIVQTEQEQVDRMRRETNRQLRALDGSSGASASPSSVPGALHMHRYRAVSQSGTLDGNVMERKRCRCGAERVVISRKGFLHRRVLSIQDVDPLA
jgi:hypothetical protein